MLGRQQHGHIESIGFDMYVQMLERAVAKLKGEEAAPELRTTLSLGMDVRIPPEYIPSENLRLRTYKRVSSVASEAEKQDVHKELEDRFGALPKAVENLLEFAVLKSMCERLRIAAVERQGRQNCPTLPSGNDARACLGGEGRALAKGNQARSERRALDGAWNGAKR